MKVFKNTVIKDYKGQPIQQAIKGDGSDKVEVREVKLSNILWAILNSAPLQTQQDSINGMMLAKALDAAKDGADIEMEEGVHNWLKPIAERATPQLFRVNGSIVYEHIKEGFEKPHKPAEKAPSGGE